MDDFDNAPTLPYLEIRKLIRSGDILLCAGNSFFSTLIQQATKSKWSHVAFVLRLDMIDRIMILESVESVGVRTVTLSSYMSNYNATCQGYPGQLLLARHTELKAENITNLSRMATNLLGYPYDKEEIVRIAAKISMGLLGLKTTQIDPYPTNEFICSEYVYACFKSIGLNIDYDPLGFIAPVDFANCPKIKPIAYIENPYRSITQSEVA